MLFFLFRASYILLFFPLQKGEFKTLQAQAQGSSYRVVYENKDDRDFSNSIDSLFALIDKSMSLWDVNSLISKVNANQPYGHIDPHFEKVFSASQIISKKTNGYFDVTVGPLVKAWGFGKTKGVSVLNNIQLDSLRKLVGYKNVRLERGKIVKKDSKSQLDFNAIAQGYTVDLIAEYLIKQGVDNYLVEVGGEVRASGRNEKSETWKVGIENPADENSLKAIVSLNHKSLATSGSYRKFFIEAGKKYSYAIDPFSGRPVSHNVLSVTVLANTCVDADAYATAFLVMGLEKAKIIAKKAKIDFFAIYEEASQIKTFATDNMKKVISD